MTNTGQTVVAATQERAGKPSIAKVVNDAIMDPRQSARFQAVLPRGFDITRFSNLVLTAVKSKPALVECFGTERGKMSLLLSVMQAATLGLEPDTPLQEAWLLPRKIKGVQECQLSIGYVGIIKLARRSGEVRTIYAETVHERDEFTWRLGTDPSVVHVPAAGSRGALTHAYAVVRYKDDGFNFVVLDEEAVNARRAQSDSWKSDGSRPYSPWTTNTEAMWRKSAVRALRPYLPLTAEAASALDTDERVMAFADDGSLTAMIDAGVADEQFAIEAEST